MYFADYSDWSVRFVYFFLCVKKIITFFSWDVIFIKCFFVVVVVVVSCIDKILCSLGELLLVKFYFKIGLFFKLCILFQILDFIYCVFFTYSFCPKGISYLLKCCRTYEKCVCFRGRNQKRPVRCQWHLNCRKAKH